MTMYGPRSVYHRTRSAQQLNANPCANLAAWDAVIDDIYFSDRHSAVYTPRRGGVRDDPTG